MENILELKNKLSFARKQKEHFVSLLQKEEENLEKQIESLRAQYTAYNIDLIGNVSFFENDCELIESQLREALINNYINTGAKTFDSELSVRVTETIKYPTRPALEWAKSNAPFLVQEVLDKKGFDPIAKAHNEKFGFVEIEEKVSAVISKKL